MLMLATVGGVEVQSILFSPRRPLGFLHKLCKFPSDLRMLQEQQFPQSNKRCFPHGRGTPSLQSLARSNLEDLLYCDLTASFTEEEGKKIFGGPPHYPFLVYHNF